MGILIDNYCHMTEQMFIETIRPEFNRRIALYEIHINIDPDMIEYVCNEFWNQLVFDGIVAKFSQLIVKYGFHFTGLSYETTCEGTIVPIIHTDPIWLVTEF